MCLFDARQKNIASQLDCSSVCGKAQAEMVRAPKAYGPYQSTVGEISHSASTIFFAIHPWYVCQAHFDQE